MAKAIDSYRGRIELVNIVRELSTTQETSWWLDRVEDVPGPRFDTEADRWDGKRHLENILWLRANKNNGFSEWNWKNCMKQLEAIKKRRELLHKEFDYIGQMMGW